MKLSVNWLLELVNFSGSVPDLDALLTRTGLQVESVQTRGAAFENVVVAQILESERHPNADRLSVCKVADGTMQPRQIVCGAKNYRVGDKVPLALPGAVLPGNFKIQVGKLRGVESQGMLCSAKELALAGNADGLLILSAETVVGAPISSVFPSDSILDLEITPNRGDWLSHLGVAREVAAFTGEPLKWTPPAMSEVTSDSSVARIEDGEECPVYSIRRIRGVRVFESPAWLRSKLEAVGLRSVNNVVDVTNYVLFLMGQPLHAFDAARVQGGILVRSAREGEGFRALDGRDYSLSAEDIVISDEKAVVALAGVMGGADSGVSANTTDILLESAVFDPARIRRTSRRMELSSDSSYRFERGVDASSVLLASELAAQWICEVTGGVADATVVVAGEAEPQWRQVLIRHAQVVRLLGLDLDIGTIRNALERVGLISVHFSKESSSWKIPGFRRDLTREVDLIEEVARIIGIEAIPEKRSAEPSPTTTADACTDFRTVLHQRLTARGFFEARTSTLVSDGPYRDLIAEPETIRLKNPLGEDQALLRPALVPGLLSAVKRNLHCGQRTVRLYEMGKIFRRGAEEEIPSLGMVMTGVSAPSYWRSRASHPLDLYDLKGVLELVAAQPLHFISAPDSLAAQVPATPLSLPGSLCLHVLTEAGQLLGVAGQLAPGWSRDLGAPEGLFVAELWLEALREHLPVRKGFSEIPRYPVVVRDIAIVLQKTFSYENIRSTLLSAGEPLLSSVMPFDVFEDPSGAKLPADRKSIAVSLVFRSSERTLTSEEVTAAEERLKRRLISKLGVEFRES